MRGIEPVKHSLLFLLLLVSAWADIRKMRIPNWIIGAAWTVRISLFVVEWLIAGKKAVLQGGGELSGSILITLGFIFFASLSQRRFGFGDVKLIGVMALYQGAEKTLFCLFHGLSLAACICLVLLAVERIDPKDRLPLAPFFLAGYIWMHMMDRLLNIFA